MEWSGWFTIILWRYPILSGSVEVTGGNIGYGVLKPVSGNSMKGGSVTISEEVQLELPLESKIEPRETVPTERKHSGSPHMITSYQMEPIRRTYPCIGKMIQEKTLRFIRQRQK